MLALVLARVLVLVLAQSVLAAGRWLLANGQLIPAPAL